MQPNKQKNTRYQPRALYATALLLLAAATTVCVSQEYDLPWVSQAIALLPSQNYVHWRTRGEAWKEAKATHKPVLYFIFCKRDSGSVMLESQCLGDPKVAQLIEDEFIPVRYSFDRKHSRNKAYEDDPEYKYFRDKMQINCDGLTPCVVAVAPSLKDAKLSDITSSANLVELGISDTSTLTGSGHYYPNCDYGNGYYHYYNSYGRYGNRTGGAVAYGYTDKIQFLDFLYSARMWHKLPPTRGRIHWLPADKFELDPVAAKGKKPVPSKPKLLVFANDVGSVSDTMRLNLFWKDKSVDYINKKFDPYLFEFRRGDREYNKRFAAIKERYHIGSLPAVVVTGVPGKAEPAVAFGFNNIDATMQFMETTLGEKLSVKQMRLLGKAPKGMVGAPYTTDATAESGEMDGE